MPTYLDFDSTKNIRNFILSKTLQKPNGPQTFTSESYTYHSLSSFSNTDPGDVVLNDAMSREERLNSLGNINLYKPTEYTGLDRVIDVNIMDKTGLPLKLYPYFNTDLPKYNLVGILGSSKYESESKLFQFAQSLIKREIPNVDGPVYSRLKRNLEKSINGKSNLIDALNGSTTTAINLITGKESLFEFNNSITVAKTLPGKAIDFVEAVTGIEYPYSQIPGDYLTNPLNTQQNRPHTNEFGRTLQDIAGNVGSLVGIQRRPLETRKPSDLFIEYMGQGQKSALFNNLSYSKYAPNYTTTARSQNSSNVFNLVDNVSQGVKNVLGLEAPAGISYIGDDRSNHVKYATIDVNDYYEMPVYSNYYLSLMFDKVAAELFHNTKSYSDGGSIAGELTWISRKSQNKLGKHNLEYSSEQSDLNKSLSTNFEFRDSSILAFTQYILDSKPDGGAGAKGHAGHIIDQTSRSFREGDVKISRGSAIKFVDKYNQDDVGIEYCRVWTKDRAYANYSDTMKRTGNIRKFDSSVMGGQSRPWNINYAPMSNGQQSFESSTNIVNEGSGFFAKKYMFSIENLAWKTSNSDGFRVSDLPVSERGNNGGRVMWFPPYNLKISEQNSAKWEENTILGRPEPIYTYQNASRSGAISFSVIVDHPSIMNLLVREEFKNLKDEEADNFIMAFFAGCKELDFYDLIQKYTTLDPSDIQLVIDYLNDGKGTNSQVIEKYKYTSTPVTIPNNTTTKTDNTGEKVNFTTKLYFQNDKPEKNTKEDMDSDSDYGMLYNTYSSLKTKYINDLKNDLNQLLTGSTSNSANALKDKETIIGKPKPLQGLTGIPLVNEVNNIISLQTGKTNDGFNELQTNYGTYNTVLTTLKTDITDELANNVVITVETSSSSVADNTYNFYLGIRRANSIIKDIFNKITKTGSTPPAIKWINKNDVSKVAESKTPISEILKLKEYTFNEFGYETKGKITFQFQTSGEFYNLKTPIVNTSSCSKEIYTRGGLKETAPLAFYCRQATVKINYEKKGKPLNETVTNNNVIPITSREIETTTIPGVQSKKPTINVMQRIIMKTLSEAFYFKKLEEDSPLVFKSLVEKLKYFHPGFHSMTPEGLNARLTFLLQCLRPGETIPIKGNSDSLDINARNTSFGPPPVCVLRIGDFYNSKVIIRDVNIAYEESTWDLNPEGIGVQPMIANVTLAVSFIGGHSLDKPVERLQNALSSNFFANTEMYDERSKMSATATINGQSGETFTREFLTNLQNRPQKALIPQNDSTFATNLKLNEFIGKIDGTNMVYDDLINNVYNNTNDYHDTYVGTYNDVVSKYGNILSTVILSNSYRRNNTFDYVVTGGSNSSFGLFGTYEKSKNTQYYITKLITALDTKIDSTDIIDLMGFSKIVVNSKKTTTNDELKRFLKLTITNTLNGINEVESIKNLEKSRNKLIFDLDKINFLTTYGHDATINDNKTNSLTISGFTTTSFYSEVSLAIETIKNNTTKFESMLDKTSIDFEIPNIDNTTLLKILSVFFNDIYIKSYVVALIYNNSSQTDKIYNKIDEIYKTFTTTTNILEPIKKINRKNTNSVRYPTDNNVVEITNGNEINDVLMLYANKSSDSTKFNYYRK